MTTPRIFAEFTALPCPACRSPLPATVTPAGPGPGDMFICALCLSAIEFLAGGGTRAVPELELEKAPAQVQAGVAGARQQLHRMQTAHPTAFVATRLGRA